MKRQVREATGEKPKEHSMYVCMYVWPVPVAPGKTLSGHTV